MSQTNEGQKKVSTDELRKALKDSNDRNIIIEDTNELQLIMDEIKMEGGN